MLSDVWCSLHLLSRDVYCLSGPLDTLLEPRVDVLGYAKFCGWNSAPHFKDRGLTGQFSSLGLGERFPDARRTERSFDRILSSFMSDIAYQSRDTVVRCCRSFDRERPSSILSGHSAVVTACQSVQCHLHR